MEKEIRNYSFKGNFLCNIFPLPLFIEFKMAGFWGSNRISALKRNENNLAHYCSRKSYDVIVIDALTIFFDNQNTSKFTYLDLTSLNSF